MKILLVCLGNICRSPTAEGVLRHAAATVPHLKLEIDSAGTGDYHRGAPPDVRSQRAALARGIDLSTLKARQVRPADFEYYDLILAMDLANLRDLKRIRPPGTPAELRLFLDYAPQLHTREVPDPYNGGVDDFEQVLDLTTAAAQGLISALQQRTQQPK